MEFRCELRILNIKPNQQLKKKKITTYYHNHCQTKYISIVAIVTQKNVGLLWVNHTSAAHSVFTVLVSVPSCTCSALDNNTWSETTTVKGVTYFKHFPSMGLNNSIKLVHTKNIYSRIPVLIISSLCITWRNLN
jgi:hypothetical protein